MTLQEHMDTLGLDARMLAHLAMASNRGMVIREELINRALQGGTIAHVKAQAMCDAISSQYGIKYNARTLTPEHIDGMTTFTHGDSEKR